MLRALQEALDARAAAGLLRRRRIVEHADGPRLNIEGRELVAFCSNDYLGLASHPDVAAAFSEAAHTLGTGAGAAHLISGHHRAHHELEEAIATFTGRDRALVFSTGYMANLGIGSALAGRGALVVEDRLNHASLLDAALGSGARLQRYAHGDALAAAAKLDASNAPTKLLMTDGVFSMDGDLAPLPALAEICASRSAWLVVDDAHGLGVLGEQGGGSLEHFSLGQAEVPVLMGTLGKAFGVFGAFVAGPEAVIETLVQHARTYIYTTALPPAVAAAATEALRVTVAEPWRRQRVLALVSRFRDGAAARGIALMESHTPIQPILIGDAQRALDVASSLEARGFLVMPIRPPTVPDGTSRLRITLSAAHEDGQVDGLLDALVEVLAA